MSFKEPELNKNYKPTCCWDQEMNIEEPRIFPSHFLGNEEKITADMDPKQEDRIPLKLLHEQAVGGQSSAMGLGIHSFPPKFLLCKSQEVLTVKTKSIRITMNYRITTPEAISSHDLVLTHSSL